MHETHLYGMQRIEPMPANETSSACEVGQKAIAASEFRHEGLVGTSRNTIGAIWIPREVPPSLPPQQLVKIQVARMCFPKNTRPCLSKYTWLKGSHRP